jgi:hypothetical protein
MSVRLSSASQFGPANGKENFSVSVYADTAGTLTLFIPFSWPSLARPANTNASSTGSNVHVPDSLPSTISIQSGKA